MATPQYALTSLKTDRKMSTWQMKHKELPLPIWSKILPSSMRSKLSNKRKPKVAVINLHGMIMRNQGGSFGGRKLVNFENTKNVVDKTFDLKRLEAVFLNINSPGGSPVQTELIADYIQQKADLKKVPVVSFVEDVAASGGYWLATAAPKIYVSNSSVVGSIGVISQSFGFHEAIQKLGIESRLRTAGKNKAINNPFLPRNPEDDEIMKQILLALHENFKKQIISSRGNRIDIKDEEELFSGKIWVGEQAVKKGLVDGVQTMPRFLETEFGGLDKVQLSVVRSKSDGIMNLFQNAGMHAGLAIAENIDVHKLAMDILNAHNDPSQRVRM